MADNTINARIKQKYDTEANWSSKNPVLLAGEMAISSDKNGKHRVGDGTHKWSELSYAKADLTKSDVTTALGYTPPTTNTTYNDVTQSAHGLMTAADKKKLDGIATGANAYSLPTASASTLGGIKVGTNLSINNGVLSSTNTWRPVETTLSSENLNNIVTPGFYSAGGSNGVTNKPSGVDHFGMIVIHRASGSYYTQIIFNDTKSWRRYCVNGTWGSWAEEKLTDTVYTHPSYTAKSNGLYKVTVDATGHVSATTAVAKSDITALGIPSTNTTYSTGTASTSGLTKLYTGTGTATDGTMTQAAIKSALDGKAANTQDGTNSLLSKLPVYTADPKDDTYLIRQDTGGANVFGRVTFLTIWNYIKGKVDSAYLKLSGGTVTGATSFTNTTASTSKSTGAVKVSGGMGVAGRMSANEVMIGDGCTLKYDSNTKCVNFVFS